MTLNGVTTDDARYLCCSRASCLCNGLMQVSIRPTMVIGRRHDVPVTNETLYLPGDVENAASSKGTLHPPYGIDYFAVAGNHYPWHHVPDLVIGRPGYDNFLVATATLYNVSVVDATDTVVALHQTDMDGNGAGHFSKNNNYNRKIIRKYPTVYRVCWRTDCTRYKTKLASPRAPTFNASPPSRGGLRRIVVVVLR